MYENIQNQVKDAMRARDQVRLTTLRGILAAFTSEVMAKARKPNEILEDNDCIAVIRRLVKQRKDSIEQFEKGNRPELAEAEKAEMQILEEFLPAQMSEDAIRKIVKETLQRVQGEKNVGKITGAVMKETAGQADGALVKKIIEEIVT